MNKYLILLLAIVMYSCGTDEVPIPKPRAFPKVVYPEKTYQKLDVDFCSFTFEYPTYVNMVQDSSFFGEKPENPCWFELEFKDFNGKLYCSYHEMDGPQSLEELKKDAFEMADWHNKKANYIDEILIRKPNGVSGFAFDLQGPAATPFQFYLTDSTKHFFRGSLYYDTQVRPDSMAPITSFIKEDIFRLLETFEWVD